MGCGFWDISLIACFSLVLVGVGAGSDELPPPENLTLSVSSDYSLISQWSRPAGLDADCEVSYQIELYLQKCPPSGKPKKWRTINLNRTLGKMEKEMCFKIFTISSSCPNKTQSRPLFKDISQHPVKDLSCVCYSSMKMNCSWSLDSDISDLQLYYGKKDILKPCVSYIYDGFKKTGCHLYGEIFFTDTYHFLVNGTDKGVIFQNHFDIGASHLVKIPPLKLNITTDQNYIYFQSSKPDFPPDCLKYHFYYKKCNEDEKKISGTDTTQRLEYDKSCSYTARVQAEFLICGAGESEMSETVSYGRNNDPNWPLKASMIVTPLIVSCCLIVVLVLCRRHKESIFPKIPAPPLLLKDVLSNNRDKGFEVGKLYEPHEDVVEKISVEPESIYRHAEPSNTVSDETLSVAVYKGNSNVLNV